MWLRKCLTREPIQYVSRAGAVGEDDIDIESTIGTLLILCLVMMLAVPASSHAGSATNRGDLPTGGTVQIPIIPEKAPGKLAGSLALALKWFTAQDDRLFLNSTQAITGAYGYNGDDLTASGNVLTAKYTAPVTTGGWAGLSFYLTDTVWATFYYGRVQTNPSQWHRNQISTSAVDQNQHYVVSLIYSPDPAIRLGFGYAYYTTRYARNANGFDLANPSSTSANGPQYKGALTVLSFAAQYFF
jgi:hypothetical protein